jgi:hypothetical protein
VDYFDDEAAATLDEHVAQATARRAFERALNDAARACRDSDQPLEVQFDLGDEPVYEPLWITVRQVELNYGDWTFAGPLLEGSRAVPLLRAGLPQRLNAYEVTAFRTAGGPLIQRPQ